MDSKQSLILVFIVTLVAGILNIVQAQQYVWGGIFIAFAIVTFWLLYKLNSK